MIKQFLYYILFTMMFSITLNAAPARGGLHTYTQPDGSTFQAYLKGDASFHWMENDSGIVLFNPQDHYFYKAEIDDTSGQLHRTHQRISQTQKGIGILQHAPQRSVLSKNDRERLMQLYRESKIGPHPR